MGAYSNHFVIRKGDSWRFTSIKSLQGIRLGCTQDYNYGESLNTYIAENRGSDTTQSIAGNNVVERNLKKLLIHRIDAYVEDWNVIRYTAKKMGIIDKIDHGGRQGTPIDLYIAFSPVNPNSLMYAKLLSDGLMKMRKSGELAKILEKYSVIDWQKEKTLD